MYGWQTLTLARVEHLDEKVTGRQYSAARDLVYAIGSRQFPETQVYPIGDRADDGERDIFLVWVVDHRAWSARIDPNGLVSSDLNDGANKVIDGVLTLTDAREIRKAARWLLFGGVYGKIEDE